MLVTDMKRLDDKRYCLYIDYEPYAPVYDSDIRRLGLECGREIDGGRLECFRTDYLFKRALSKAVGSIKFSDKCEHDIRQQLSRLCYDEEIIDATVAKLISYGYLDDSRHALGYIRRHCRKKSMTVIRHELAVKNVSQEAVDSAIQACELPDEDDIVKGILTKRYTIEDMTHKRDKVLAYMYGKGFDIRRVNECMRELTT